MSHDIFMTIHLFRCYRLINEVRMLEITYDDWDNILDMIISTGNGEVHYLTGPSCYPSDIVSTATH